MIPELDPVLFGKAFNYSMKGLKAAFKSERSFRQEIAAAVVLIPLALWLGKTGSDKALMIASIMLVFIVELVNTIAETLVERISPEWNHLSGKAKDVGSASVFIALINVVIVWALVLFG